MEQPQKMALSIESASSRRRTARPIVSMLAVSLAQRRESMAGQIGQQHTIIRLEQRRQPAPEAMIDRCRVQKDHARAAAAILVMEELRLIR